MPKDSKIKPQDSGMSLPDLYNLLRDVLSKNPYKNKNFLKYELKLKPLIEVSKHSFDDACSPLAIVDFKILEGAYQHYLENPDCLTQKTPIPSPSGKNNEWKDSVFISLRDSNAAGTSDDSELEKALCELQMSEIGNNISDPEVLDLCNEEFSRKSFSRSLFNSTVPVTELSPSVSFSPLQSAPRTVAVESVVTEPPPKHISVNVGLSEQCDVPYSEGKDQRHKTEISKDVRRKKTLCRKRKKCKKKNNVQESILVRNVNSTDSSEMLSPPSETQVKKLILLGPQDISQTSEGQADKPSKILKSPIAVLQNQSPTISSQVVEPDKQSSEIVHEKPKMGSVVTEMLDKLVNNSQTFKAKIPKSKSISKEDTHKIPCDMAKVSSSLQNEAIKCFNTSVTEKETDEVFEKDHHITRNLSDSGFTESEKDVDKNSNISISPLDHSNFNAKSSTFFAGQCSTENQHSSHPQNQQEVDNYNNIAPRDKPSESNNNSPVDNSIIDDSYDVLDYEYDEISEHENDPVRNSPEREPVNYSGDENVHSTEDYSCYSEVTGGDIPGQEMCPASDVTSSRLVENAPCLTNQQETEFNEICKDTMEREISVTNDVAQKVPWNPPKIKSLKRRISDDDSSDSDSEQSFKRRNISSSPQSQHRKGPFHGQVPEPRSGKLSNVISHIQISCDNHKISEAVKLAAEYLEISSRSPCIKIFEEIFLGIRDSVHMTNVDPQEPLKLVIEKLKSFIDNSNMENREEDIKLCSMVIYEYFQHSILIRYAVDLCLYLQNKAVPIRNRAIEAYANNAISVNAPTNFILNLLTYSKKICRLPFNQPLLKHVLQKVTRGKECYILPDFNQLCELLCLMDDYEIERQPLQGLTETCIENNCWDQIAHLFIAWSDKKCFPTTIPEVLLIKLDEIGIRFQKFAEAIFGVGEPSETCKHFFGLIGVNLIMNICESGLEKDRKTKKVYLVNANNVLHTLHKYNVDIFGLMKSSAGPNPCSVVCSPFSVFFTSVEICLRLKLPKDAFLLFNNYSPYLKELPQVLSDAEKSSIRLMQLRQFIRVTQSLHLIDPLESGLSAFHDLMLLFKQEDVKFYLKDVLNDWESLKFINLEAIKTIFTNLMVTFMNRSLIASLNQLYQYITDSHNGPWEYIFMPMGEVLRGLLVTFAKFDKMEEARSLFILGCSKKIYKFEKPLSIPWVFTLISCWTNQEMRFVIERFMHLLFPFLSKKKSKAKFEDCFTVKITFKEYPCSPPQITGLIVPPFPTPLSRACSVLKSISPDLTWTEHENYILLTASSVYNYWFKKYFQLREQTFNVSQSRPPVFGMNADNEESLNLSMTPETPAFHSNQSSSSEQSIPSTHHRRPSNELRQSLNGFQHPNAISPKKMLLNSSERSSSNTPEGRTSVYREPPRHELKTSSSFERSGSICESSKVCNENLANPASPASKRRRTDSEMSHCSNFNCTRASQRQASQQQSPVASHRSQRKNGLIQSQTITASHQSPPQTGRNQFEMSQLRNFGCSRISPKQTSQRFAIASYQLPQSTDLNQSQSSAPPLTHSSIGQVNTRNNSLVESNQLRQNTDRNRAQRTSSTHSNELTQSPKRQVTNRDNLCIILPARLDYTKPSTNDCLSQYKNISSRPSLLVSPPKPNNFATASPCVSDESELSLNNVKTNVIINSSNGKNTATSVSKSPIKPNVTIRLKTTNLKIYDDSSIDAEVSNLTSINEVTAFKKNESSFLPNVNEPSTSLTNHSPGLPPFTAPLKPAFRAKRKLNLNYKEPYTPKVLQYKIQTPCKRLKVIRPITPVVKSSARCTTPLMFNSGRPKVDQNLKRPIPTNAKGTSNMSFGNFTVSFGNSSGRLITAPSDAREAPKNTRKFTPITFEPSRTTASTRNDRGFPNTLFEQTNIVPTEAVTNVPSDVFQRIMTFIKSQLLMKCKSLSSEQLQQRAMTLAKTFVENNSVKQLDSKTRTLLCKFAETII